MIRSIASVFALVALSLSVVLTLGCDDPLLGGPCLQAGGDCEEEDCCEGLEEQVIYQRDAEGFITGSTCTCVEPEGA